ncbi:MAG: sodium:proton antiporter [Fimbriimonas ginsengisoli]|uniref:Sodium:proton antiporter n=1 Tax=Fimbriimonas ginsengisoli TaxID=1005039 RepID=A0A931LT25_FIMGI|nr:sodium:proton antiporter [Fimbriimonas ginsengisoli]
MGEAVVRGELLLLVAALVAILARRLRLSYTVGLLVAGIALAFSPIAAGVSVTKDLIFLVFLPPLVFEAAFLMRWDRLRANLAPITLMATLGLFVATAVVALGLAFLLHWDWRSAALFAALISATDPVSVIALMKERGVEGRLRLLLEGESLFNDGTAAALFVVALQVAAGGSLSVAGALQSFALISIGGIAVGLAVGFACVTLMGRAEDHLVEICLSAVAAFGSFLLAERLGLSGVLATLCAGLVIGNYGPLRGLTAKGRDDAETFWEFAAFVANSLVFLLMGLRLAHAPYHLVWLDGAVAIGLVLFGRAVAVVGSAALFSRGGHRIGWADQKVLVWGGLRGALALGLALGIPAGLPQRDTVVAVAFVVVGFSIVVQGLTVGPMLRRATVPVEPA